MLVDQNDFTVIGSYSLGISLSIGYFVGGSFCQIIQTGLILIRTGDLFQTTACEVFKAGVYQFQTNLIIIITAGLICIKGSGGSMIQVDRADHADLPVLLFMKFFGDGLVGG